jgi:hypothetical protein
MPHDMMDPDDRTGEYESVNPYADALSGSQPREIAEFELNLDPYANMVPRVSQRVSAAASAEDEGLRTSHRPLLIAVSVILVAVLVLLPLLAEVFSRLGI